MSTITYNYEGIAANVKDYRGYQDFILSIRIKLSATDGTRKVVVEKDYELDVSREFTEENPFLPFEQWNSEKVLAIADQLIEKAHTRDYLARQLRVQAAKPTLKNFNL